MHLEQKTNTENNSHLLLFWQSVNPPLDHTVPQPDGQRLRPKHYGTIPTARQVRQKGRGGEGRPLSVTQAIMLRGVRRMYVLL